MTNTQFNPDYIVTPGEILLDILESRGINQVTLANRCNRPEKAISEIIHGKKSIVPETALQFERVLGISANTWLNMENNYKIAQLRQKESEALGEQKEWIKNFPYNELVKRKLLESKTTVAEKFDDLLRFFGVSSIDAYTKYRHCAINASFRHSAAHKNKPYILDTWMREGEICANKIDVPQYDKSKFEKAVKAISQLTRGDIVESFKAAKELAHAAGVVIVLVDAYKGSAVNGVARWINGTPTIQLTVLRKSADILWFSFLHECAHILKHSKKETYIDNDHSEDNEEEREADKFARDCLISPSTWNEFVAKNNFSVLTVKDFAQKNNIADGIVVGRLQKEKYVAWNDFQLNRLKQKIALS